jgi:hypothetical protein
MIGTVETVAASKSNPVYTGDGSRGTCHHPCASPREAIAHSTNATTAAPPATAPSNRRPVGRVR